jgi:CrcB protein
VATYDARAGSPSPIGSAPARATGSGAGHPATRFPRPMSCRTPKVRRTVGCPTTEDLPTPATSDTRENASNPPLDRLELLAIAGGGALGALTRVGVAQALPSSAGSWPWATFAVNIAGALMLGYFVTRLQERLPVSTLRRPLLGTGLCGALTTFSTVQIELLRMVDRHAYGLAAAYLLASVTGGYFAVFASSALVRRVRAIT